MPNYAYRAVDEAASCEECAEQLVVFQKISDEPLSECTACGNAVRKVIVRAQAMTNRRWNTKKMLSDGNLKRLGFKKLVKEGEGRYVDVLAD